MIYINQDIGKIEGIIDGIVLEDVIRQVNADNSEVLKIWIKTNGGDLQEAKDIYEYLKSLNRRIETYADGNVDSAGTIILLAGDTRIGFEGISNSLIHSTKPVLDLGIYESDELINVGEGSKTLTDELVKFYSNVTGQPKEAFSPLVRDETILTASQMKDLGFLTEVREKPIRAVAFKTTKNKIMSKEIEELKKENEKQFKTIGQKIDDMLKKIGVTKTVNMVVQDANGTEIDFYEKEEGEPEVGDKANIDGNPASGEHVMPDGETLVFESGALTEIKPAEGDDEEMAALKEENENLKAEVEQLKVTNKKSEEKIEEFGKEMKKLKTQFTNLSKNVGSNFQVDDKIENPDEEEGEGKPKNRKLFKEEE